MNSHYGGVVESLGSGDSSDPPGPTNCDDIYACEHQGVALTNQKRRYRCRWTTYEREHPADTEGKNQCRNREDPQWKQQEPNEFGKRLNPSDDGSRGMIERRHEADPSHDLHDK